MKIALSYRVDLYPFSDVELSAKQLGRLPSVPVESYARCVHYELEKLGHTVDNVYKSISADNGEQDIQYWNASEYDIYIELDNGRDGQGNLGFGHLSASSFQLTIPTAVWFVDSHGHPDLHKALAPSYKHVFFAVWDKRDLFTGHPSAHWCPNATDPRFFYPVNVGLPAYDFGFFGSKTGLDRADKMVDICKAHGWTYDVRQIGGGPFKHKWPRTCEAMNNCKVLFNHGQKHDAPNLRVLESMAVGRPLISDQEDRSGMDLLFVPGKHYLPYESYTQIGLEAQMVNAMNNDYTEMAEAARKLVLEKHLIKNRVEQMLEVFNATV